jgi:hypothetical protein
VSKFSNNAIHVTLSLNYLMRALRYKLVWREVDGTHLALNDSFEPIVSMSRTCDIGLIERCEAPDG